MKTSVDQSGGYAGQTQHLVDIDTERLDPAAAQEVEQMVRRIVTSRPADETAMPLGADLLTYKISISDDRATRTVRFTDDGGPEVAPLRELVSTLTERARR
jgi:Emfourin